MAVNKANLEKAVAAALNGPEDRDLRIESYRFNVKPAQVTRDGATISVVGDEDRYISRRRRLRPNDRIYYEFDKVGGMVHDLEIDVDRGGLKGFIERGYLRRLIEVAQLVMFIFNNVKTDSEKAGFAPGKADEAATEAAYQETKRLLDGSWEGEASFLVANIALRAK